MKDSFRIALKRDLRIIRNEIKAMKTLLKEAEPDVRVVFRAKGSRLTFKVPDAALRKYLIGHFIELHESEEELIGHELWEPKPRVIKSAGPMYRKGK